MMKRENYKMSPDISYEIPRITHAGQR